MYNLYSILIPLPQGGGAKNVKIIQLSPFSPGRRGKGDEVKGSKGNDLD